ncbi:MAG TPA: N-acetylglucosamine-6-phosphate deacetylase [Candidatus Gastranaerophilales bacterium]|nr:N-acetylglucosamine-6-phosphate deacetylase [Candidatus Gastranaerophilales bacterium]
MKPIQDLISDIKSRNLKQEEIKATLVSCIQVSKPDHTTKIQAQILYSLLFSEKFQEIESKKASAVLILNGFIQNPGEEKTKENILIYKDIIVGTSKDLPDKIPVDIDKIQYIDAQNMLISPGLIDQHIHGGYNCDFNTSDEQAILNFLLNLPKHGVTSICPTIMTDSPENIEIQIKKITAVKNALPLNSTKIIGINLEGPFLNAEFKGAHCEKLFLEPTIENYKRIESDEIRIITIAPELDKNFELTKYLSDKGVIVSAGHSNADRAVFSDAVSSGLTQVTHIFNAMPSLHHRQPGIIGNSLINDDIYVEIIADHNHLHQDIIELILRIKPDSKAVFISDSLPLNHSELDSTVFGGQKIFKHNEIAINETGKFAGSLMFLDSVIRKNLNLKEFSQLLMYCSFNPAKNLRLDTLGCLKKGMTADLVFWEDEIFKITSVFINGQAVFF